MANTINTVQDGAGLFAKGVAQALKDNMGLCQFVEKADESEYDGKNGFKAGDTIYTSIPQRKIVQEDNLDISSYSKDVVEEKAALTLNKTATTADEFDSLELATNVDVANALKRFGMPAAEALAQSIEARCFQVVADATYNFTGTAGSNSFAVADVLASRTKLNQNLCPLNDRMLFMNSASGAQAVDARKGFLQSSTDIAEQYRNGYVGRADGFDWMETELLSTHTNGTDTAAAAMDAIGVEGASTIAVKSLANGATVTKGTVLKIAGVNRVHPITKTVTNVPQQIVVTADATADGTGDVTLSISPPLYAGSGGLQNITALPQADAVITFETGTASEGYVQNIAMHKSAFKMVTVPLYKPKGVDLVASASVDGITVNIVRDFNVNTRKVITRYDVLYAFDPVRPEWSVRLTS